MIRRSSLVLNKEGDCHSLTPKVESASCMDATIDLLNCVSHNKKRLYRLLTFYQSGR